MHEKLKKILSKKRDLSPNEKHAKMDVVKHLRDMASEAMGDKLDGLKKVSVMSDSPEGLKAGLHKASEIVSDPQMDQMKNHAENPYGDYKSALEEHADDESNDEAGFDADQNKYSDGGEVSDDSQSDDSQIADPDKLASAQDSMRKAFGYNEGGEVESPDMDESEDGYAAREEADDSEDGSPADQDADDEGDENLMSEDDLDAQLEKLMALKKKMSSKKS